MLVCGTEGHAYGAFKALGETQAHRVSFVHHFGVIPSDLNVCHRCDNPSCVRPEHMFLGTNFDNARDAVRKGRNRPGRWKRGFEGSGELAAVVKIARAQRNVTQTQLSVIIGCRQSLISRLEAGKSRVGNELALKLQSWLHSGAGFSRRPARGPYISLTEE